MGLVVRLAVAAEGLAFLLAAALNFGLRIQLGSVQLAFAPRVWQAGAGEVVIGGILVLAAASGLRRLACTGLVLSALGIAFGLASRAVQGPARAAHLVMVPLALAVLVLLVLRRPPSVASSGGRP